MQARRLQTIVRHAQVLLLVAALHGQPVASQGVDFRWTFICKACALDFLIIV
jgi:hypothetical protein